MNACFQGINISAHVFAYDFDTRSERYIEKLSVLIKLKVADFFYTNKLCLRLEFIYKK